MSHAQRLYIDIEEYETNARGGKMGNTVASMNDVEGHGLQRVGLHGIGQRACRVPWPGALTEEVEG